MGDVNLNTMETSRHLSLHEWVLTQNGLCNNMVLELTAFSSVQSLSHVWLFMTPWTAAHYASLSITNSWSPPKPMSVESVIPSNHLIFCHPLLLLPLIFPSIRVFSTESALLGRWPKYWSFSFSISPSSERPELISFRMDRLDLLAVQGTLKNLLQHHSTKTSVLLDSAFLIVQLSHPSVRFGCSVVSNSLWPHEPQHARHPCPLPTPRVFQNPCPLSWW